MPAKLKPATPRHSKHDSACPACGEPFVAARFLDWKLGDYDCARCGVRFGLMGDAYYIGGIRAAAWQGEPLPGGN